MRKERARQAKRSIYTCIRSCIREQILCFCPQDGFTALHMAAQEGNVNVVRLLTEAKAHVNIQMKVCHVEYIFVEYIHTCSRFSPSRPS